MTEYFNKLKFTDVIDLFAKEWKVKYVNNITYLTYNDSVGLTEADKKQISVHKDLDMDQRKLVLLHEFYHATEYEKGNTNQDELKIAFDSICMYRELYGQYPPVI